MTKESQPKEEIELGSLFITIGNGFSKLFNFIGSIFKEIFHLLILFLLFLKRNTKKLVLAAVIGGIIGTVFEFNKESTYGADMQVQPNFKSTRQLYNNVNYYNDLVKQKDTISLALAFGISSKTAATLKKFNISPIKNGNDLLTSYDDLILSVDTLTAKSYSFAVFKNTFTDFDYKVHRINVVATKNNVFSKLDRAIISSVVDNSFYNKVKMLSNQNLQRTDSLLKENLIQIDSLRKVYMTVLIEEAKKNQTGTSIDLGGEKRTTKELELFEVNRKINKDLKDITKDRAEKSEVLNVISNFQPIGYEIKGIGENYGAQAALLGFVLMVLFLSIKQLNNYLNNYKK
ncbi:MAG: hypothetical protein P8H13_07515 [Polaribacter sp.]|nr:hypothetical protein [Polaribacter sp.]MDG1811769.1 hypothetical protein [Polaribacter sp.]MDG1994686.1 hypothetical protein [Polaribacter sp.]